MKVAQEHALVNTGRGVISKLIFYNAAFFAILKSIMKKYDHKKIERKWQKEWEKSEMYKAETGDEKGKDYLLVEFPYPSGDGLHVGHVRSYTAMDIIARKHRAQGKNVLYPMGWDAFGLPTENFAVKTGIHPKTVTKQNTDNFRNQLKALGLSFDWSREINTTDPGYYKWTQWIFTKLFEHGLAYKTSKDINWCLECKIGLANEEVLDGACERCEGNIEKREKEQWMLEITKYADRLVDDLEGVDYWERIKEQQRNWIGRSEGAEISFKIQDSRYKIQTNSKPEIQNTKPQVVIVHGWDDSSKSHFIPHTKKTLKEKGVGVIAPDFPNATHPSYEEWKEIFEQTLENMPSRENLVLVGHSLGGTFLMKYLTENDLEYEKLLLVAPPTSDLEMDEIKNWFVNGENEKYKLDTDKVVFFGSDDDPYNPQGFEELAEKIGVELTLLPKRGHFKEEQFPELVNEILPTSYQLQATIPVFTTRPDTLFGATYLVLSPEHKLVAELLANQESGITNHEEVQKYIDNAKAKTEIERTAEGREKTGVKLEGITAINPAIAKSISQSQTYADLTQKDAEVPVFVADYVLAHYGTGAIMAVPAHDTRDWEFATRHGLEIRTVIKQAISKPQITNSKPQTNTNVQSINSQSAPYEGEGMLVNSGRFDGLDSEQAKEKITEFVGGTKKTTYKLRDWVFSRQRYWGEPIPLVFCEHCAARINAENDAEECGKTKAEFSKGELLNPGWVVDENLPVELPEVDDFMPAESGESPLAKAEEWVRVACPKCGGEARRETDVMPNWAGSSWYYLRYTDPSNAEEPASKDALAYWTPVDWYNGGMEHTTLHLLYSRFWHKFLYDIGAVPTKEPYAKRTSHGIVLAEGGEKMSKSKGNVINPDDVINDVGADALRVYEMFMGPFSQAISWNADSMVGARKFLERVWRLQNNLQPTTDNQQPNELETTLHKTIKKVGEDIENMKFNTAIAAMMTLVNEMEKTNNLQPTTYNLLLTILSPFAPHMTEELWHALGNNEESIHRQPWPEYDEEKIKEDTIIIAVQVNGKVRGEFEAPADTSEEEAKTRAQELPGAQKWLEEKNIERVVYVPGRLVNIVVA